MATEVHVLECDVSEPGSLDTIEAVAAEFPGGLVLVVPAATTAREMKLALKAGAAGLVREPDVPGVLDATVEAVGGGQMAVPVELARQNEKPVLSRRQKQVLGLVVMGLRNSEIALQLHLSEHTVKCHLYSAFRKLGVNSREAAVSLILDPDEGLGTGILKITETSSRRGPTAQRPA
jgi:DNA-binding NarL/FixJ family response regulator